MSVTPVYVSKETLQKMEVELHDLKTVKRREAAARIESAKDAGDLKENADYHDAKDASGMIEARIRELEHGINNAVVISATSTDAVCIGCRVKVEGNGKEKTFAIVGSTEANPVEGRISNESPLGMVLLGKKVGEVAEFKAPAGVIQYTVKEITC